MSSQSRFESRTLDPLDERRKRLAQVFADPRNHDKSNREIAVLAQVDEATARRYRNKNFPQTKLQPHTGRPAAAKPTARKRKRKPPPKRRRGRK